MGDVAEYVILAIIALMILTPIVARRIYKTYRFSKSVAAFVSKPFVCPNCGHRFYTEQKIVIAVGEDKVYLKCPACKKRDLCGRPYDFDESQS